MDQRLPILTTDNWLINRKKKAADTYISKLKRDSRGKPIDVTFDKHKPITREQKEVPKINNEELTEEIAGIYGIKPSSHIDNPDFEIALSNYEDDEITKYSLIRKIKSVLESEFCGNMDKISKVNISQNERDLTVAAWL